MKYIYFLLIVILLASCETANEPIMEDNYNVLLSTKSLNEDIANVHILVYKNGRLITKKYSDGNKINFSLSKGKYTFYAIANTYLSSIYDVFYKSVNLSYENKLNNAVIRYNVNSLDGIYSYNNSIILSGKQDIIVNNKDVFIPTFEVTRVAALISFKISSKLPVTGYQICNINHYTYLMPHPNKEESNLNDTEVGNDCQGVKWYSNIIHSLEGSYYFYENRSGGQQSNEVSNWEKNYYAPDYAMFIKIFVRNSYTRRIYLGSNNTLNYNVKRNCKYNYIINVI